MRHLRSNRSCAINSCSTANRLLILETISSRPCSNWFSFVLGSAHVVVVVPQRRLLCPAHKDDARGEASVAACVGREQTNVVADTAICRRECSTGLHLQDYRSRGRHRSTGLFNKTAVAEGDTIPSSGRCVSVSIRSEGVVVYRM